MSTGSVKTSTAISSGLASGKNMRVLQWIVDRCQNRVGAQESPLGLMPHLKDFDLAGLANFGPREFEKVQRIDIEEWKKEIISQTELFITLKATLPEN